MGYPLAGDGSAVVDLFDPSQPGADGSPKLLERWIIDKDMLQRALRPDTIGWGYTLLLPWGTFRPDLGQVVLRLRYEPVGGAPIYANPSTVAFNPVQDIQATTASRPITSPPRRDSGVMPASHLDGTSIR
jgi:hypothetical protein